MNADTAYTVSLSLGWDSAVRAKGRGSAASDETERQLPRTGAAVGCEVSRVGRSTFYNRTRDAPVSRNGLALCYNGGMKNAHVVHET